VAVLVPADRDVLEVAEVKTREVSTAISVDRVATGRRFRSRPPGLKRLGNGVFRAADAVDRPVPVRIRYGSCPAVEVRTRTADRDRPSRKPRFERISHAVPVLVFELAPAEGNHLEVH